ncbi:MULTISPECIES: SDR family oxidoreductase [Sporosarcina]|uniref:SDR family oxidoreductase n=1 Tax=Sporosarcina TaxID=1569 RepID=UPI00058EEB26|nr:MULTISPECIES: SDR family oxidoreductase [Sporosarcina]WJY27358.1 SDR family oxidoreductase [Sporosarcina sp. 0.2-SM1T-5]
MKQLTGKTAIVTGASGGIGEGIARELAAQGANVVIAARSEDKLMAIAEQLVQAGGSVHAVKTDVASRDEVEALAAEAADRFGGVDFYVNNAGQVLEGTVRSGKTDEWEQMIDVNVKGVLYGVNAVLPAMLAKGSGHIINIASVSGTEVTKTSTVYSATKFAVRAISMGLEKELAKTGVRVTNISPGMVDTRLGEQYDWGERKKLQTADIAKAVVYAVTQPDYVNVNEITIRPV